MNKTITIAAAIGVIMAASGSAPARAGIVEFTWDPSQATPGLVTGPAAFTADSLQTINFNRTVNVNDLTTLKQTVTADAYGSVTGFTLAGAPVGAPGLNSAYGLYFHTASVFTFPISPGGAVIGPGTLRSLHVSLIADLNHDDGVLSTSAAGIGFSNALGVTNDVTLATGDLISGSFPPPDPDGTRHNITATTFQPVPGEGSFFVGPDVPLTMALYGTSAPGAFSVVPVDSQSFLTLVNGNLGSGVTIQFVPEPASIGVLAAGLLSLGYARRRGRGWIEERSLGFRGGRLADQSLGAGRFRRHLRLLFRHHRHEGQYADIACLQGLSRSLLKFVAPALLGWDAMRRRLPFQEAV